MADLILLYFARFSTSIALSPLVIYKSLLILSNAISMASRSVLIFCILRLEDSSSKSVSNLSCFCNKLDCRANKFSSIVLISSILEVAKAISLFTLFS